MPAHDDNDGSRLPWPGVALGVLVLAAATALGVGPVEDGLREAAAAAAAAAPAPAPVPAVMTPPPAADASAATAAAPPRPPVSGPARVETEGDAVVFYFAGGSAELPSGAAEALSTVVMGVAAGKKAVIGSVAGDAAEDLPKRRALAVQGVLTALGIGPDKLELRPHAASGEGGGDTPQARRVDVTLE